MERGIAFCGRPAENARALGDILIAVCVGAGASAFVANQSSVGRHAARSSRRRRDSAGRTGAGDRIRGLRSFADEAPSAAVPRKHYRDLKLAGLKTQHTFPTDCAGFLAAIGQAAAESPQVSADPPLKSYVFATGCAGAACCHAARAHRRVHRRKHRRARQRLSRAGSLRSAARFTG